MDDRLPTTSRGLRAASETERTLKAILSFAKIRRLDSELIEEGNTFMELFEFWKKEYKVCICMCSRIFEIYMAWKKLPILLRTIVIVRWQVLFSFVNFISLSQYFVLLKHLHSKY